MKFEANGVNPILSNTPNWVWVLLAALVVLGLAQVPSRRVSAPVVLILPVAIIASTAFALLAAFGPEIQVAIFGVCAVLAGVALNALVLHSPRNVTWDAATGRYYVPGSWLPLVLILVIFAARFAVGMARATKPELVATPAFVIAVCVVLGVCCGIFVARAAKIFGARSAATSPRMS